MDKNVDTLFYVENMLILGTGKIKEIIEIQITSKIKINR